MSQTRRGRPFQKGVSGNPRGRPRSGEALAEYIRELGGVDGRVYADRLHAIAIGKHKDTRSRLTAIGTLLERGFGKPPQGIEHSRSIGSETDLSTMSDEELEHSLEEALTRCRAWRGALPPDGDDLQEPTGTRATRAEARAAVGAAKA